jgi:malonyl-CoA O-methyltransferase
MADRAFRIRQAFDAASRYDEHAGLQRRVATGLADRIAGLPLAPRPRILEIGCGTGFLTEAAMPAIADGNWLVTDIAPAMVARCRTRIGEGRAVRFATLDGERPLPPEGVDPFDLICSSLAVQWFGDLAAGLSRLFALLAPGGWLAVTTLADGTFAEWRRAHAALGLAAGTPSYPMVEALRAIRLDGVAGMIEESRMMVRYDDAPAFLRALKGIGAGTPGPAHRPLAPGSMRAVMRRFEAGGCDASYHVATCLFRRPPAP